MPDSTATPFPNFTVDAAKCVGCGECAADCVAEIIHMENRLPAIAPDQRENCIACQHCLAVCPVGAVSVLGHEPANSISLGGFSPDPRQLDLLVRGRRSFRRFKPEPVDPEVIRELLTLAAYAPTGVNDRRRRFSVIMEREAMAQFRQECAVALAAAVAAGKLPEAVSWLGDLARDWLERGSDGIFRNAPHVVVVTTPKDTPCVGQDAVIALSYFDLLAQARGVGTVWAGLLYWVLEVAAPELKARLGIPKDHAYGYAMLFGMPAFKYARTVQREPDDVALLSRLV